MKKIVLSAVLFCICLIPLISEDATGAADRLYEQEKHREGYEFLLKAVEETSDDAQLSELYWRLARVTMEVGDLEELEGAEASDLLDIYKDGETYADLAIELNPRSYWAFYWKSTNVGRWAETKGILNSLFLAKPMRNMLRSALAINPGHSNSFYVLGIMYERAPGWPLSFGNSDFAVSLGRKAIDVNRDDFANGTDIVELEYYLELARHLKERDWNVKKRRKEQKSKAEKFEEIEDKVEKFYYYEGTIDIEDMSDLDEAIEILEWLVAEYEKLPGLKKADMLDLADAKAHLGEWRK